MSRDEAVKAATEALYRYEAVDFGERAGFTQRDTERAAAAAVDALWPVIERAVRAQAAAEERQRVEAIAEEHGIYVDDDVWLPWWRLRNALDAARIVEGP